MINRTAIACLLSAAVAGGGAWSWQDNRYEAKLADMRSSIAESDRLRARAAATVLQAAQVRGDKLTSDLLARENQINRISKEKRDALNRLTTGRPCLRADAVRMLNDAPGDYGAGVPTATSGPDAADAAAATDSDIGQWIVTAKSQYATCRQRLDALIDWHIKD